MLSTIVNKGELKSATVKREFNLGRSSSRAVIHTILTNSFVFIIDMIRLDRFKDIDKVFTGTEEAIEIIFSGFPDLLDYDSRGISHTKPLFMEV